MKARVLCVLLLVVALSAVSLGSAAAGGGTQIRALTTQAVTLYAEPNMASEAVAEVPAYSTVDVLKTDESGAWMQVSAAEGTGYAMADALLVLNLPLLGEKMVVNARRGAASLFATPKLGEDFLQALPNGTVGTVLATYGQWLYVATDVGEGWSLASSWAAAPEGTARAMVHLRRNPELGVFAAPQIGSDMVGTLADGAVVWMLGTEGEWATVLLADGSQGYVIAANLSPLAETMVDAVGGRRGRAVAALFDAPDFGANLLTQLEPGTSLVFLEHVDDFWIKVYSPQYGVAYGLADYFSPIYFPATVQAQDAVVRAGPNDNLYNAIAVLNAGTPVVVKGVSESGAWLNVALPFDEIDFPWYGVEGWMRDYLFWDEGGEMPRGHHLARRHRVNARGARGGLPAFRRWRAGAFFAGAKPPGARWHGN